MTPPLRSLNKTVGIIGCGNMGSAVLAGLLKRRLVRPKQVMVSDQIRHRALRLSRRFGVRPMRSNFDLVRGAQIVLLAMKPQDLYSAAAEIRSAWKSDRHKVLVTILAGTPIAKIRRLLGDRIRVVRAMPNLGAQVGEAVTVITGSGLTELDLAERIFSACGKVLRMPEKYFDVVTAVSGCGPAYFFFIMELLAQAGRLGGLSRPHAQILAVQTAVGASRLAETSGEPPDRLRAQVTSKKGTTEAALLFLEKKGFGNIFVGGVRRAIQRSRELSEP